MIAGRNPGLTHYFLETIDSEPIPHSNSLRLEDEINDEYTSFTWCIFDMTLEPSKLDELDLGQLFYQYYIWGKQSWTSIPIVDAPRLIRSSTKLNASKLFNNIDYRPDLSPNNSFNGNAEHPKAFFIIFIFPITLAVFL